MRAVIQRVTSASITINHKLSAGIKNGLVIFLGIVKEDDSSDAEQLAKKISQLRIFNDQSRKMNLAAKEAEAEILAVSQFTLCADLTKGRRPSFEQAQAPEAAKQLYLEFIQHLKASGLKVAQGVFREYMTVHIDNDGPVTFILDTRKGK